MLEKLQKPLRINIPSLLLISTLIFVAGIFANSIWVLSSTTTFGENDFVGYWSATYLFHNGQNPYDPNLMEMTQNTKLRTGQDSTIMSWNPPPLFVLLLPLAWFSFLHAKFVWLIINLIMVITASLMLVSIYGPPNNKKFTLTVLLFAVLFPPIISGLYMGQVTFLVFFGLVGSMLLIKKKSWFWAGMILFLTTIKPHLVLLSWIYLFVSMARQRKFQGWIGFLVSGLLCMTILFLFRPYWINDLIGLAEIAPAHWATPTIGGLLSSMGITESARYLIILFLPLPFVLAFYRTKFSMEFSIAILTLITIPVTFFGWNYDQTMLLIPIIQVFSWLAASNNSLIRLLLITAIIITLAMNAYLRMLSTNDVFFIWVPLVWWLIFAVTWYYFSPQMIKNE